MKIILHIFYLVITKFFGQCYLLWSNQEFHLLNASLKLLLRSKRAESRAKQIWKKPGLYVPLSRFEPEQVHFMDGKFFDVYDPINIWLVKTVMFVKVISFNKTFVIRLTMQQRIQSRSQNQKISTNCFGSLN